jgi:uncharacterized membrane protein YhhN
VLPFVLTTIVATAALLAAEARGSRPGVWVAKPLASAGFVATALAAGALGSGYGRLVLAGLLLSAAGDVLLIPRREAAFRAGVASFGLGHVAYGAAFASRGVDALVAGLALVAAAVPAVLVLRWLWPGVPAGLRLAVPAYVVVITAMLVLAVASVAHAGRPAIAVGAAMFYVSDLAVARERFVADSFTNKLWGLPLYFGAQLVLASTVRI